MLSRRSFLVSAGAGAAAGALSTSVFANHHIKIPLGIQLWTVKSEAEKDLEGTLRKLYALGFREIEFAGYYGKPAAEVGALLKSIGLTPVSTHAGADLIASSGDQVIADAKTLGLKYIICSSPMSDAAKAKQRQVTNNGYFIVSQLPLSRYAVNEASLEPDTNDRWRCLEPFAIHSF